MERVLSELGGLPEFRPKGSQIGHVGRKPWPRGILRCVSKAPLWVPLEHNQDMQ